MNAKSRRSVNVWRSFEVWHRDSGQAHELLLLVEEGPHDWHILDPADGYAVRMSADTNIPLRLVLLEDGFERVEGKWRSPESERYPALAICGRR
jgi:hypothetical protein